MRVALGILIGLLIGSTLGLVVGSSFGAWMQRDYVLEWRATAFECFDELVECRGDSTRVPISWAAP